MTDNATANTYDFDNQPHLFGHPVGLYICVFHRNVGAVFLLRDASHSYSLYDRKSYRC